MRYLHLGRMAVKPSCEPENNFPRSKVGRPRAKFDVAEAYALRQQGWSLNALGDKFNVDATTIRSHLRGYEPAEAARAPAAPMVGGRDWKARRCALPDYGSG